MQRLACVIVLAGLAAPAAAGPPPAPPRPKDAVVRAILDERVKALGPGVGIVAGLLDDGGTRVVAAGTSGTARPLDGGTVFEIGSVTKVFTALLLAEMARGHEVALDDRANASLPTSGRLREAPGHAITLLDLATHTAGLPFMPDDLGGLSGPEARPYDIARLERFLARQAPRADGAWDYSNLGYWALGRALAAHAGMGFETLLRARVIAPLGLTQTAFALAPPLAPLLTPGHGATLQRAPAFGAIPVFAPLSAAGGLHSSADDILRLLAAATGRTRSPLAPALAAMLVPRRPTGQPGVAQALAWTVIGAGDDALVLHEGATFGYASAVAWDPRTRNGVVVLSNQVAGVADVARHLLRASFPLETPAATRHVEITLDTAALEACAGRYEADAEGVFVVAREGAFLTFQAPADWGLPVLRLRPESRHDFFAAELPLRVTFETDPEGRVMAALIHPPRGQKVISAVRTNEPHPMPPGRRE